MPTVTELKVRITGDASSATAAFAASKAGAQALVEAGGDLTSVMAAIQKETALAGNASLEASAKYATQTGSLKGLTEAEKAQVVAAARTRDAAVASAEAHKVLDKTIQEYARDIALSGRASAAAAAGYDVQRGALAGLTEAEQANVIAMARMRDSAAFMADMPRRMETVGRSLTMGLTVPVLAGAAASVKLGADFETTMTKVQNLAGAGAQEVANLTPKILALSEVTGKSATDLGEGLYFVESMGFRGAKAMDILTRSAEMSASGMGSTADIARTLTAAINSYGAQNLSAARASDVMTATIRNGAIGADEMAGAMGRILPVGAQLQVDFGQLGGVLAASTRTGQDFNEVVTGIRQIMVSFEKPSNQMNKALARVGLTFGEVRKAMSVDFIGTLMTLNKAFEKQPEMFAKLIKDFRAFVPALSLIGQNYKENQKIIEDTTKAVGDQQEVWRGAAKTMNVEMQGALRSVENSMIDVGASMAPTIKDLSKDVEGLAHWFEKLNPDVKHFAGEAFIAGAVLGPVIIGFNALRSAIVGVIGTGAAFRAWAFGAAAAENAVGASAVVAAGEVTALESAEGGAALGAIPAAAGFLGIGGMLTLGGLGVAAGANYLVNRNQAHIDAENKSWRDSHFKTALDFVRKHGLGEAHKLLAVPETYHDGFNGPGRFFSRYDLRRAEEAYGPEAAAKAKAATSANSEVKQKAPNHSDLLHGFHDATGGGGGGGGKKGKGRGGESDEEKSLNQYKEDMYELAKSIALGGDESDSAGLKYDILHGHLDGLSHSLALNKLRLTEQKESLEKARDAAKEHADAIKEINDKYHDAIRDDQTKTATSGAYSPRDLAAIQLFGKAYDDVSDAEHRAMARNMAYRDSLAGTAKLTRKLTDDSKNLRAEIAADHDLTGFSQYVLDHAGGKSLAELPSGEQKQLKSNWMLEQQKGQADYDRQKAMSKGTTMSPAMSNMLFGGPMALLLQSAVPKLVELNRTDEQNKQFGEVQESKQKEFDLLGMTTDAERAHYEVSKGIYEDLAPDQKDWIEGIAQETDAWHKNQDAITKNKDQIESLTETMSGTLESAFEAIHTGFKSFTANLIEGWEKTMLKMSADWISSGLSSAIMGGLNSMHGSDPSHGGSLSAPSNYGSDSVGLNVGLSANQMTDFLPHSKTGGDHGGGLFGSIIGLAESLFSKGSRASSSAISPGSLAAPSNYGDDSSDSGVPPRAMGGDVMGGMPYLVGEHRPEVFVPRSSGTILPDAQAALSKAMGQGGPGDTYHIHNNFPPDWSGDRKSVDQALRGGFAAAAAAHARTKR
jgi:TP901 family phage tail tape measure protein